jgi:hypothetical protein
LLTQAYGRVSHSHLTIPSILSRLQFAAETSSRNSQTIRDIMSRESNRDARVDAMQHALAALRAQLFGQQGNTATPARVQGAGARPITIAPTNHRRPPTNGTEWAAYCANCRALGRMLGAPHNQVTACPGFRGINGAFPDWALECAACREVRRRPGQMHPLDTCEARSEYMALRAARRGGAAAAGSGAAGTN